MSMRGKRILTWMGHTFVVGSSAVPPALICYQALVDLPEGERSVTAYLPPLVALALSLAILGWLCVLLVRLPRYWTEQGITADRLGINVTEEPLWWFRGNRAHVPWTDVHHITGSRIGTRKSFRLIAEVHLSRVDRGLRLPLWAALVPSGRLKWGVAPSRPALLFDMRSRTLASDLESVLRSVRADLFKGDRAWDEDPRYLL